MYLLYMTLSGGNNSGTNLEDGREEAGPHTAEGEQTLSL